MAFLFHSPPTSSTPAQDLVINPKYDFSPKFHALVSLLLDSYKSIDIEGGEKFCGIVFVKRRVVAKVVAKALAKMPNLEGLIKCESLCGHAQLDGGMNYKKQNERVSQFR